MCNMEDKEKEGNVLSPGKEIYILDGVEVSLEKLNENINNPPSGKRVCFLRETQAGVKEYRTLQRLLS